MPLVVAAPIESGGAAAGQPHSPALSQQFALLRPFDSATLGCFGSSGPPESVQRVLRADMCSVDRAPVSAHTASGDWCAAAKLTQRRIALLEAIPANSLGNCVFWRAWPWTAVLLCFRTCVECKNSNYHYREVCHRCAPLPRRDCAHPCTGTGLIAATSAPGLGVSLPHLRRDWAHPWHISTATCAIGVHFSWNLSSKLYYSDDRGWVGPSSSPSQ